MSVMALVTKVDGEWHVHDVGSIQDEDDYFTREQVMTFTVGVAVEPVHHAGQVAVVPVYMRRQGFGYVALDDLQAAEDSKAVHP